MRITIGKRPLAAGVLFAACVAGAANADLIDFESAAGLPFGAVFGDDAFIAPEYGFLSGTTTVFFGWERNGDLLADAGMRFEDYNDGLVESAGVNGQIFCGFSSHARSGFDLDATGGVAGKGGPGGKGGGYFMRVDREGGESIGSGSMLMRFTGGLVGSVSGSILDVDHLELYRVTAYAADGSVLGTLDSPAGPGGEGDDSLDSLPWDFTIGGFEQAIAYVRVSFLGDPTVSGGWGFDNFAIGGIVPAPGALALLGLAGCLGGRRRR